ncbi:7810_t:CDS:2, partial [Funneliformis geosporum]
MNLIYNDAGVFLSKRINKGKEMYNLWQVSGEKVEENEDSIEAVIRETEKEIGLIIKNNISQLIFNDPKFNCDVYITKEEWKLQDAYFAEAEVFEKRINVMINTGAVRCIITKRFLDLVNKEIEASTKNNEKYSFCQKLYEDLEDYRVAKAQIEEDDELIEITKGKDTSIRSLTNIQRMQLQQLLTKNKDLFANNKSELTQTN